MMSNNTISRDLMNLLHSLPNDALNGLFGPTQVAYHHAAQLFGQVPKAEPRGVITDTSMVNVDHAFRVITSVNPYDLAITPTLPLELGVVTSLSTVRERLARDRLMIYGAPFQFTGETSLPGLLYQPLAVYNNKEGVVHTGQLAALSTPFVDLSLIRVSATSPDLSGGQPSVTIAPKLIVLLAKDTKLDFTALLIPTEGRDHASITDLPSFKTIMAAAHVYGAAVAERCAFVLDGRDHIATTPKKRSSRGGSV